MKIIETSLAGVYTVESFVITDQRGLFFRFFCEKKLAEIMGSRHIQQINYSVTHEVGTVRGFHYQYPPHAEMKLIRCLKGRVWDVVLDLRESSATFLQWHAEELSANNEKMMIVPEGCAHGFQVLDTNSELLYLHTNFYSPEAEGGIHVLDPIFSIDWPLPINDLSEKDNSHAFINEHFSGIVL